MTTLDSLDRRRGDQALQNWLTECKSIFKEPHRFPDIDFDSNYWPLRKKYSARVDDIRLSSTLSQFDGKKTSYGDALRCDISGLAIKDNRRTVNSRLKAWTILAEYGPECLHDLHVSHLRKIETAIVEQSLKMATSKAMEYLSEISQMVDLFRSKGLIQTPHWSASLTARKKILDRNAIERERFTKEKQEILDRQIEALSDATRAMFSKDPRLSNVDRTAIACMGLLMAVPSRVNEPLCMSTDDSYSLDDYAALSKYKGSSELQRAHLLLLQKGSKGAEWGAKPALTFMIDFVKACMKVAIEGGQRSRMLAAWYEANPSRLYLPADLEYLRGQPVDRRRLWQIVNLSTHDDANSGPLVLKTWRKMIKDSRVFAYENSRQGGRHTVQAVSWSDAEKFLLSRVHASLEEARKVTSHNGYLGKLSNMLFLVDTDAAPYLIHSLRYQSLSSRMTPGRAEAATSVFEKLGLKFVVDGRVEYAWIGTHDPRRWLTTQALLAKGRLSDVIINKWANRLRIEQLPAYFHATPSEKADIASMPLVRELSDFSAGLKKLEGLEEKYGLKTEMVLASDASISMTSMDAIANAVEERPIARTSNAVIILYPTKFGACLHQHHEAPCTAYDGCGPCNENHVVKGHIPTNEAVRKREVALRTSLIRQISKLVSAHNLGIADEQGRLEEHVLALVRPNLSPDELADYLIEEFHEIKDRIKSVSFKNKLEEAFVMTGHVKILDSPEVPSGALSRYHNPGRHASPGHERALDAHGGREAIDEDLDLFRLQHPEFGLTSLGIRDQRDLLSSDDEDDETLETDHDGNED